MRFGLALGPQASKSGPEYSPGQGQASYTMHSTQYSLLYCTHLLMYFFVLLVSPLLHVSPTHTLLLVS